jgi:hypothetical protein
MAREQIAAVVHASSEALVMVESPAVISSVDLAPRQLGRIVVRAC